VLDFSRPGKPTDDAFAEAFDGRFREERLSAHRFLTFADARERTEAWRRSCTADRPHGAIGYEDPMSLADHGGAAGQPSRRSP
jgi:putative transposase